MKTNGRSVIGREMHRIVKQFKTMINYIKGDLFDYVTSNDCIIHVVNNAIRIGGGFTAPLIKRFPYIETAYYFWFNHAVPVDTYRISGSPVLGEIQIVWFRPTDNVYRNFERTDGIYIVNMMAQESTISATNPHPLKYDALEHCLRKVADDSELKNTRIIAPKFGAGLAGGDWNKIESLINAVFHDREITIFEL